MTAILSLGSGMILLMATLGGQEPAAKPGVAALLQQAHVGYEKGLAQRSHAQKARSHFQAAARCYESLWQNYHLQGPGLQRNRAQAHLLAGNLPQALRAYQEGRQFWPADRTLQAGQRYARKLVGVPRDAALARAIRPSPESFRLRRWVSLSTLQAGTLATYLLGWLGVAGIWRTRSGFWWVTLLLAWSLAGLGVVSLTHEHQYQQQAVRMPWAVVAKDNLRLRQGNADAYPARFASPLPVGTELRVLAQRGDWNQVMLPDQTIGWLPADGLLEASLPAARPAEPSGRIASS